MFKTGQKVVCVDGDWVRLGTKSSVNGPQKDKVYTVSDETVWLNGLYLKLVEFGEDWWYAAQFRPVDELFDQIERIEKEGCPAELLEEVADYMELCNN